MYDYCATFGRIGIGNQLLYSIGKRMTIVPLLVELVISYSIGKCVIIVPLLAQLVIRDMI